jgi:hypothetical protein
MARAAVLMTDMFRALAAANDDYPTGQTIDVIRSSPEAEAIVDAVAVLAASRERQRPFGPTPELVKRFAHEKRGMLLTIAGRYEEADAAFAAAYDRTRNEPRGRVKVRAARILANYLAALRDGKDTAPMLRATRAIAEDAKRHNFDDIAGWAHQNVDAMSARSRAVRVYEML